MPSQFQAVVDVFDNQHISSPNAKSPLINFHEARMAKIFAKVGARTCDTADAVENATERMLGEGKTAKHCAEEAVSDIAEMMISSAIQAGEAVAKKVKSWYDEQKKQFGGRALEMKEKLEAWAKETFGGEYQQMKDFYNTNVKPKVQAMKGWLKEKQQELNDGFIETLECAQAGYNSILNKVDALAYNAGEMAGCMRKVVCGMGADMAGLTRRGLEGLGYKHQESVHVAIQALHNDTRCLRTSQVLNNIQAAVTVGVPPTPMPEDVPGASVANNINGHTQRMVTDAQVTANRFSRAHNQKLEASIQAQATSIIHSAVPAEKDSQNGTPSSMPPVSPAKAAQLNQVTAQMVNEATLVPIAVENEMLDTLKHTPRHHQERQIKLVRTLPEFRNTLDLS